MLLEMAIFHSLLWLSNSPLCVCIGFPAGSAVKSLLAVQETQERRVQEDPWRRAWQPTPVFLPGTSHGLRSPAGQGL